jgi:ribosome-binding protein aMBF1 (putative translation factor)
MALHNTEVHSCKRGHFFTPSNTIINKKNGQRHCKECAQALDKTRYARRYQREKQLMTHTSEMRDFARNPKLNWDKVTEIRRLYKEEGFSQRALARKFEVSQPLIGMIVRNECWRTE